MTNSYPIPTVLAKAKNHIRKLEPDKVRFCIAPDMWKEHFPKDADVRALAEKFRGGITRAKVLSCAPKTKKPTFSELRPLFIATMMWGYGNTGYGPWRTSKMLKSCGIKQALPDACSQIIAGDWQAANDNCAVIRFCDTPYFTKFLYFVGRAQKTETMPLILDSFVYDELHRCAEAEELMETVAWHKRNPKGFVGTLRVRKRTKSYALYVKVLNSWARRLKVKPDQLEYFLFDANGKRRRS